MSKTLKTAIPFIILIVFAGTSIAPLLSTNSMKEFSASFEKTTFLQVPSTGEVLGSATRTYENDIFSLTLSASLTEPKEDNHYEAWIIRLTPFKITDIGQVSKSESGTYDLQYTESNTGADYEEFSTIVITEESDSETAETPNEIHVLEGTF